MTFRPGSNGVQVNTIEPMGLKDLSASLEDGSGDYYDEVDRIIPLERLCLPSEVVGVYKPSFDPMLELDLIVITRH